MAAEGACHVRLKSKHCWWHGASSQDAGQASEVQDRDRSPEGPGQGIGGYAPKRDLGQKTHR